MRKSAILIITVLLVCFFAAALSGQEKDITTVFLVRHAEKVADESDDPELTAAGQKRAEELAYVLKDIELDAVFSTAYKRTLFTAQPSAKNQDLKVQTISSLRQNDLKEYVDTALEKYKGGKILIVSHSNIVHLLVKLIRREEIDRRAIKNIDEKVYDDLFVVSFSKRENAEVLHLKYGERAPLQ
ncbi:phosphoglycerate mutase family protein [candidate division KSB1 bacterium]